MPETIMAVNTQLQLQHQQRQQQQQRHNHHQSQQQSQQEQEQHHPQGGGGALLLQQQQQQYRWKLDPEAVRRRAHSIAGCREVLTVPPAQQPASIVSFLVGLREVRETEQLARVSIFCDSGTIGVCRVLRGEVRQTFRRNVTSLDVVERMLKQPPKMITIDHTVVGLTDGDNSDDSDTDTNNNNNNKTEKRNQEPTLRTELELAEVGLAILGAEKEKLEQHLAGLQLTKPQQPQTQTTSASSSSSSALPLSPPTTTTSKELEAEESLASSLQQGMEFQFSLSPSSMKHVDQCLTDINKMGKLIKGVSTNGRGTVFLYGNGGVAYTPNIPRPLHQRLSQIRNSTIANRPAYVSLGTRDRFFVAFHNGSYHFKGPKGLDRELKHEKKPPLSVAFGNMWDTFFIVFHDGSWKYQGRSIPDALEEKLASRSDRPDLVCVNLGPNGEWFLKARNGRMWWGGVSDETDTAILDLLDAGHELNMIDFGEDGSYFVSYD